MKNLSVNSMFLYDVTLEEMNKIISSLKNGAPGYDEINASVLKIISSCVTSPLVYLCNKSLEQGIFPNELKLANVLPLYKADDPFVFNNYRPVSLLCVLSKVFEKVMYNRLIDYLETYKILVHYQFGFRKKSLIIHGFNVFNGQINLFTGKQKTCYGLIFRLFKSLWYCWSWYYAMQTVILWYSGQSSEMVRKLS